ncbi:hypothetical protein C7M84_008046 [Penaeus vannamei]|uniref:Uncharacterized protein n=1 Tax=Penaeus vannamei TaxID=6689 RepID=A0A423TAP1_PENVA|nr:hypothetical protein C7M84_008046 [Penaeus vannamei]
MNKLGDRSGDSVIRFCFLVSSFPIPPFSPSVSINLPTHSLLSFHFLFSFLAPFPSSFLPSSDFPALPFTPPPKSYSFPPFTPGVLFFPYPLPPLHLRGPLPIISKVLLFPSPLPPPQSYPSLPSPPLHSGSYSFPRPFPSTSGGPTLPLALPLTHPSLPLPPPLHLHSGSYSSLPPPSALPSNPPLPPLHLPPPGSYSSPRPPFPTHLLSSSSPLLFLRDGVGIVSLQFPQSHYRRKGSGVPGCIHDSLPLIFSHLLLSASSSPLPSTPSYNFLSSSSPSPTSTPSPSPSPLPSLSLLPLSPILLQLPSLHSTLHLISYPPYLVPLSPPFLPPLFPSQLPSLHSTPPSILISYPPYPSSPLPSPPFFPLLPIPLSHALPSDHIAERIYHVAVSPSGDSPRVPSRPPPLPPPPRFPGSRCLGRPFLSAITLLTFRHVR